MKLAVFGTTTNAAQRFIKQVLQYGYTVNALHEAVARPQLHHENLHFRQGSIHNEADVISILRESHAVICLPGTAYEPTVMNTLTACMYASGLRRIVVSTDNLRHLEEQISDESGIASILQRTSLDWTIVHAMPLDMDHIDHNPLPGFAISVKEFTKFIVSQITDVRNLQNVVMLNK